MLKKIGKMIARLRKEKDLSQAALGKLAQCSQMTIQRIESGSRGGVRLDYVLVIAEALNTSLADILFEVNHEDVLTKKSQSRCEYLFDRIQRLNPNIRDWICDFLEKLLDRSWI